MNVEIIESTPNPERLVCTAARNDYRTEGVADFTYREVMEDVDASEENIERLLAESEPFSEEAFRQRDDVSPEDDLGGAWLELFGGEGRQRELEAKQRTLMDHLIVGGHWGPWEHPQVTLELNGVSRVLMAQITRHRHFTFDIMSLRYVGLDDGFRLTDGHEVEPAVTENITTTEEQVRESFLIPDVGGEMIDREGVNEIDDPQAVEEQYVEAYTDSVGHYLALLEMGVPQEEARRVLPMGTKVNIVVSANARAWMHILNVRTKGNVQGETQECAKAILDELESWMPYTFQKYREDVLPLTLNP